MPNGDEIKQAEWRGYILKALEVVEGEIDRLSDELNEANKEIDNLVVRQEQSKIYRKLVVGFGIILISAIIGGIITAILMLVV